MPLDVTELNFDLAPVRLSVKIDNKPYWLTELTGDAYVKHQNDNLDTMTLKDGKPVKVSNSGSVDPKMVSYCLFDANDNPVPLKTILSWPSRVYRSLAKTIRKISEMDENDDVEALETQRKELDERITKLRQKELRAIGMNGKEPELGNALSATLDSSG